MEDTDDLPEGLADRLQACAGDWDADLDWLDSQPAGEVVRAILEAAADDRSYELDVHVSNPLARRLVALFSQARQDLTGADFDAAWERISFSMDVSVWGGDTFRPILLPNGALVIRNHHRVIGTADAPVALLHASRRRLRREVARILKQARRLDPLAAFLIHRDATGAVMRTRRLPRRLSETGQSLLLLNDQVSLEGMRALTAGALGPVMAGSRSGHAVLRFFGDHVLAYQTHRLDDGFDILLEEFAEAGFDEDDEDQPVHARITPASAQLLQTVSARTREMLENEEYLGLEERDVMFHHLTQSVTAPRWGSYAGRKVSDMMRLPAFFAATQDRPSGYGDGYASPDFDRLKDSTWKLSVRYGPRTALLFVPLIAFAGSHEELGDVSAERIADAFAPMLAALGMKLLCAPADNVHEGPFQPLRRVGSSGTLETICRRTLEAAEAAIAEAGEEVTEEDARDIVRDTVGFEETYRLAFILLPARRHQARVDLRALDNEARLLSGRLDSAVTLHVPRFGLIQSYDRGDDDSGNAFLFAPDADFSTE